MTVEQCKAQLEAQKHTAGLGLSAIRGLEEAINAQNKKVVEMQQALKEREAEIKRLQKGQKKQADADSK